MQKGSSIIPQQGNIVAKYSYGYQSAGYITKVFNNYNIKIKIQLWDPNNIFIFRTLERDDIIYTSLGYPYNVDLLRQTNRLKIENIIVMFDLLDVEYIDLTDEEVKLSR